MEIINPTSEAKSFLEQWASPCAYITAYTSGSTGAPKTVRLPKADMVHSARATCRRFGLHSGSLLVSPLSADYIAGKMMIVRAIEADCRLIFEPASNRPLRTDYGPIDLLPIVPSQVDALLADPYPSPIANIIIGGAPLSPQREEALSRSGLNAVVTYGMTETCSHVALREIGQDIYRAMPGIEFDISPQGALIITSEEYSWRRLVTRDAVTLIDPRSFRYHGRLDNVINSGGIKLHPEEIERQLSPHIATPFYVRRIDDIKWGEAPQLVIEDTSLTKSLTINPRQADEGLREAIDTLPSVQRPKSILLLPHFPRTMSGKIIRQ